MPLFSLTFRRIVSSWRLLLLVAAVSCSGYAVAQGSGYWHTSGDRILNEQNQQVRITGINWYGFETSDGTIGGLHAQDYKRVLETLKAQGFNTVRIPLSSQMIESPSKSLNIAYRNDAGEINGDLMWLNSLQVLDKIVSYAGQVGLKVILDHHRSEAGGGAEANGLWYTNDYPESAWIADWVTLAGRYLGNSTVVGFDLHNEPHSVSGGGACWDCGGANDWHLAAERAGNAVLRINPKLMIFVEGVDAYRGDFYWWGGNLEGVQNSPVTLAVANQLVYSAHEYGPHEASQRWFNNNTTYASLSDVWSKHWAFISQEKIAPVWIGEFGTTNLGSDLQDSAAGSQGQWFQSLVSYLDANRNLNWSYWAVNGEDNYGLLTNTYNPAPASPMKLSMLAVSHAAAPSGIMTARVSASSMAPTPSSDSGFSGAGWALLGGSGLTFALVFTKRSKDDKDEEEVAAKPVTKKFFGAKTVAAKPAVLQEFSSPASQVLVRPELSASAASTTQVNLNWTPSGPHGMTTYTLYVGTSPETLRGVAASGLASRSYVVTRLQPGTEYFFVVKAAGQGLDFTSSNVVQAVTLGLPVAAAVVEAAPMVEEPVAVVEPPVTAFELPSLEPPAKASEAEELLPEVPVHFVAAASLPLNAGMMAI